MRIRDGDLKAVAFQVTRALRFEAALNAGLHMPDDSARIMLTELMRIRVRATAVLLRLSSVQANEGADKRGPSAEQLEALLDAESLGVFLRLVEARLDRVQMSIDCLGQGP